MTRSATILIVPGLRDHVAQHWQTLLAARLQLQGRAVHQVPAMGRDDLDCAKRVAAIEREAQAIEGPLVVVAHSGGCIMVAHWARHSRRVAQGAVQAALLATPPDFEQPMPVGYPTLAQLRAGGWLPVPRAGLPFRSLVAASRNDPLGSFVRVAALATDWGSELVDLGEVGHLNPASGFGDWPRAITFIAELARVAREASPS